MIRVATLIWKDGYGGAERSVRDLAAALDRNQVDMQFYYLSGPRGRFSQEIADMGYEVVNLNWGDGFSLAGRWRLLKLLHQFDPMIVHDHLIPPLTRPLIKLYFGCPVFHTEHGEAMRHALGRDSWRRFVARFDLLFCDCILANSYASREAIQRAYKIPVAKIKVLYLGIDLSRFDNPCGAPLITEKCKRIGYVGRINIEHKGTDYLPKVARALEDMGYQNFEFIVIGDGPDRLVTERLCEQLKVSHLFTFLGWRSDIQQLVSSLDILILPSRFESFGLAALEALAMGVKVVGFDVGGVSESVGGCSDAWLVQPGDVTIMAQTIVSVLTHPQPSTTSRAYVEKHFSHQRMASDLMKVYKEYVTQD